VLAAHLGHHRRRPDPRVGGRSGATVGDSRFRHDGLVCHFPVQHLADGLHHAYLPAQGGGVVWSDLAVHALWAAGGLTIALRRFTWTPATATS
jgi:hypothetical protein